MYNEMIDEFDDDARRTTTGSTFDDQATATVLEPENNSEGEASSNGVADETAPKAEELVAIASEEDESWSDDPVRMYLTQMGEIPLLTRKQEIALAKKIETTRARFRCKLLECDYVIQSAFKILRRENCRSTARCRYRLLTDWKRNRYLVVCRIILKRLTCCSGVTRVITVSLSANRGPKRTDVWPGNGLVIDAAAL